MVQDIRYYPDDTGYFASPESIYADWVGVDCPNPCRKYHISSAIQSAKRIADAILPYLVHARVRHKVVKTQSLLQRQMQGDQAGKFITLYMAANVEHKNATIQEIAARLATLKEVHKVEPSPRVPRSRPFHHVFIEMPLDENMFIYGGDVVDPHA